jgi:hypothetical protein
VYRYGYKNGLVARRHNTTPTMPHNVDTNQQLITCKMARSASASEAAVLDAGNLPTAASSHMLSW